MFSVQRKDHHVIEAVQAVDPIVANQTLRAVLLDVFIHKSFIVIAVAVQTRLWVKGQFLIGMAGCAQYGRLVVIHGMYVKGKFGEAVVESHVVNLGRTPIKSRVAGRAVGAEHPCVALRFAVAGNAVRFCAGESSIGAVAFFTLQGAMFASQREAGE